MYWPRPKALHFNYEDQGLRQSTVCHSEAKISILVSFFLMDLRVAVVINIPCKGLTSTQFENITIFQFGH